MLKPLPMNPQTTKGVYGSIFVITITKKTWAQIINKTIGWVSTTPTPYLAPSS